MKSIIHTNTQVSRSQLIRFFWIYNDLDSFKNRVEIMLGVFIKLGIDREFFFLGHELLDAKIILKIYQILIFAQKIGVALSRPSG